MTIKHSNICLVERCQKVTPDRNPRHADSGEPSDTLVVKNLPYSASAEEVLTALVRGSSYCSCLTLFQSSVPKAPPVRDCVQRIVHDAFNGTVFATYESVEHAISACRYLKGAVVLGRRVNHGRSYTNPNISHRFVQSTRE